MPSRARRKVSKKILEHELVPKHEVLSFEEATEVLRRLGIAPNRLPSISVNDPIVQLLGAKPGDIIRITRRSPTAGEAVYYRIVVAF
ncbi:MAG: DNA-directed RNA polymerase subunit H [Desulfurococcales archaeon]|nr:DNA-directed RNA polymerase subunit H [Desulfurococcales archaeon]